jgi:hypothetical protein
VGANISVLVFSGLVVTLFAAMVLPAPARRSGEGAILLALLVAAGLATVLTGAVAFLDLPTQSAVCGVIAWLLVVQCIWLARSAGTQEEWDEEEDDDDGGGGSQGPSWPSGPPAPDDGVPWLHAPEGVPAHAAPAPAYPLPAPAHSFPLVAVAAAAAESAVPAASAEPPAEVQEAAHERRLRRPPRRLRGEHGSIAHVSGTCAHAGRRRRASRRQRFLRSCRRLLWPEPPGRAAAPPSFAAPEHEGRRHAPAAHEAGSRSAVL